MTNDDLNHMSEALQQTQSNDSFDKVKCCLDIVAVFGNDVGVSSFRQSRNKLNMFNSFRLCRRTKLHSTLLPKSGNIAAKTATMSKQHST